MAAQRATTLMRGNFCIGGAAELTIITKDRIEQRVVKRWPDKIGERIVA